MTVLTKYSVIMVAAMDENSDREKTISIRANSEFVDEFDRALKQAQLNGSVDLGASRSEAIRRLMAAAIEDPSMFDQ